MGKILLSTKGGRVTRYLFTDKPSDLIPFKGKFPILEDYQMTAYYDEVQNKKEFEDCSEWVQNAIEKAEQIYLIENGFISYLNKLGIKTEDFEKMKSSDKANYLVRFLDSSSLGLNRLKIN